MNPEIIRSLTPIYIATVGGVIGVAVIVTPFLDDAKWAAGLGLAGTAIAGAAGLAQTSKNESFSVQKRGDNLQVESPAEDNNNS